MVPCWLPHLSPGSHLPKLIFHSLVGVSSFGVRATHTLSHMPCVQAERRRCEQSNTSSAGPCSHSGHTPATLLTHHPFQSLLQRVTLGWGFWQRCRTAISEHSWDLVTPCRSLGHAQSLPQAAH